MTNEELNQQAVDAAIILENRVNERIRAAIRHEVRDIVIETVNGLFREHKGAMIMEITTSINQMLRGFIEQERKPLWEFTPEELGLNRDDLNTHMLGKAQDHAIHKDT
jgi:hypothetical protein